MEKTFLSAYWKNLIMANYVIDPAILEPLVPPGTELDFWQGRTYVSLVGFMFLDTKVLGLPIPFHRNFEEVNLRFYVRHYDEGEWKRGVVFVKEIVPRIAIASVARWLYGEPYISLPMKNELLTEGNRLNVGYQWKFQGEWNYLKVAAQAEPVTIEAGSEEEFITEHYWGYTKRGPKRTSVYQVEHPRWRCHPVVSHEIDCDVANLYGPEFASFMKETPSSVLLAKGSAVTVKSAKGNSRQAKETDGTK